MTGGARSRTFSSRLSSLRPAAARHMHLNIALQSSSDMGLYGTHSTLCPSDFDAQHVLVIKSRNSRCDPSFRVGDASPPSLHTQQPLGTRKSESHQPQELHYPVFQL